MGNVHLMLSKDKLLGSNNTTNKMAAKRKLFIFISGVKVFQRGRVGRIGFFIFTRSSG